MEGHIKSDIRGTNIGHSFEGKFLDTRNPGTTSERHEGDETGIHFALTEHNALIAVARLDRVNETVCQARFVAVESHLQGKGYGRKIMTTLEEEALNLGYRKLILHARDYALPFYERLGYTIVGPSYKLFDVLQHFEMFKILS